MPNNVDGSAPLNSESDSRLSEDLRFSRTIQMSRLVPPSDQRAVDDQVTLRELRVSLYFGVPVVRHLLVRMSGDLYEFEGSVGEVFPCEPPLSRKTKYSVWDVLGRCRAKHADQLHSLLQTTERWT
jgi:hypothetical protein